MAILNNAKKWFTQHPRSIVVYHRFMAQLPPARKENLSLPRDTEVSGTRVKFSDGSELSLFVKNRETSLISAGGLLDLFDDDSKIIVTYADASWINKFDL